MIPDVRPKLTPLTMEGFIGRDGGFKLFRSLAIARLCAPPRRWRGYAWWRRDWDSNPGGACTPDSFQDCCLQPLGHLSVVRPETGRVLILYDYAPGGNRVDFFSVYVSIFPYLLMFTMTEVTSDEVLGEDGGSSPILVLPPTYEQSVEWAVHELELTPDLDPHSKNLIEAAIACERVRDQLKAEGCVGRNGVRGGDIASRIPGLSRSWIENVLRLRTYPTVLQGLIAMGELEGSRLYVLTGEQQAALKLLLKRFEISGLPLHLWPEPLRNFETMMDDLLNDEILMELATRQALMEAATEPDAHMSSNPIAFGQACLQRKQSGATNRQVAEELESSLPNVKSHVRLLQLPREVQGLVALGLIRKDYFRNVAVVKQPFQAELFAQLEGCPLAVWLHALNIYVEEFRLLDSAKLGMVGEIVDRAKQTFVHHSQADRSFWENFVDPVRPSPPTRDDALPSDAVSIISVATAALRGEDCAERMDDVHPKHLEVARCIVTLANSFSRPSSVVKKLLTQPDVSVVHFLRYRRHRKQSSQELLDQILDTHRLLDILCLILERAIDPDPIPTVPAIGSVKGFVQARMAMLSTPQRRKVIVELGDATDRSTAFTTSDIAGRVGVIPNSAGNTLGGFRREGCPGLRELGLEVDSPCSMPILEKQGKLDSV